MLLCQNNCIYTDLRHFIRDEDYVLSMEYTFENRNHFNMGKQLIEKLLFLTRIGEYIDGAHKQGNKQAELSLQIIRAVEQKNTNLLQDFLVAEKSTTRS